MAVQIYIAAKYDQKERIAEQREKLRAMGYVVTSSWLDNSLGGEDVPEEVSITEMHTDLAELYGCDVLIIDTLTESTHGDCEVALGYVMGKEHGSRLYRIGPVRNVYHPLLPEYTSWDDFFARMPFLGS